MRRAGDFTAAVRGGARAGTSRLVVHLGLPGTPDEQSGPTGDRATGAALVGFVVPKTVGTAVMRNQVKRRLRGLMRDRVGELPDGSRLVVRALTPSAGTPSAELAQDLDKALAGARRKALRAGGGRDR
jgi:ribonuclease P protein component